jgi:hypothetical protein
MTTIIECRPLPAGKSAPNLGAVKAKQQAAWSSGDYAIVGTTLQIVGEQLVEAMDLRAGQTVLDVAAGNGNATLAAARRWYYVPPPTGVKSPAVWGTRSWIEATFTAATCKLICNHRNFIFLVSVGAALPRYLPCLLWTRAQSFRGA